jgi:hypothetical protein
MINLKYITDNWKTTAQSILTFTLAITGYLMTSKVISTHTAAICGTINGLCLVVVGVMQKDGINVHKPQ